MYRSPTNFLFSFFPAETLSKCLNASMFTTAVLELVQQFYHATETGDVANAVSTQGCQTSLEKKAKPCLKKAKPGKKSQIVK